MFGRFALLAAGLAVGGCTALGTADVHVESGNQPVGYLSRPLTLTISSDDAVQKVAQNICDNVKRGSSAEVTFVGKVPSPEPLSLGDWGRYRYECLAPATAARPASAVAAAATAAPARVDPPAAASPAVPPAASPAAAAPAHQPDPGLRHGHECLQQQGRYHVCVGNCLLNASAEGDAVAAACESGCAPGLPASCR